MVNQKIFKSQELRKKTIQEMSYEQKYSLLKELMDNVGKGSYRWLIYDCLYFDDYCTAQVDLKLLDLNNFYSEKMSL